MSPSDIQKRLAAPIPFQVLPLEVRKWDKGLFAAAAGYVDRADVLKRLDDVLAFSWQDQYTVIDPDKAIVECRIGIRVGDDWLWRGDVGTGDAADNDPLKSAYTDALKRAATHWGIGRFLYDLGRYWLPCEGSPIDGKPGKFRFKRWETDPVKTILDRARAEGVWWANDPVFLPGRGGSPQGGQHAGDAPGGTPGVPTTTQPAAPEAQTITGLAAVPLVISDSQSQAHSNNGKQTSTTTPLAALMTLLDERQIKKSTVTAFCQERYGKSRPSELSAIQYEELLAAVRGGHLAAKAA